MLNSNLTQSFLVGKNGTYRLRAPDGLDNLGLIWWQLDVDQIRLMKGEQISLDLVKILVGLFELLQELSRSDQNLEDGSGETLISTKNDNV